MKIVTVNLPETHLDAIARLQGKEYDSQYPSRSEFVRVAVKNQLLIDLGLMKKLSLPGEIHEKKMIQERKIRGIKSVNIKVPIERQREVNEAKAKDEAFQRLREAYPDVPDYKFIGEA